MSTVCMMYTWSTCKGLTLAILTPSALLALKRIQWKLTKATSAYIADKQWVRNDHEFSGPLDEYPGNVNRVVGLLFVWEHT